jgi:hypothetical protein
MTTRCTYCQDRRFQCRACYERDAATRLRADKMPPVEPDAQRILDLLNAAETRAQADAALTALDAFAREHPESDDLVTLQTFGESVEMRLGDNTGQSTAT